MRQLIPIVMLLASVASLGAELDSYSSANRVTVRQGTAEGAFAQMEFEFEPRLQFRLGEDLSAVVSGRLRADLKDRLTPRRVNQYPYAEGARPQAIGNQGIAELRDAYLQGYTANGQFRLGKQQIVWGALDGIRVLDILNPQNFEQFILDDFDRSRIPLWSAYGDWTIKDWRAELAVIPDSSVHDLPASDAWFGFTAPRFRFGFSDESQSIGLVQKGAVSSKGTLGARVSRAFGTTDVQLVVSRGPDFEPVAELSTLDGNPLLEISNQRRSIVGFAIQRAIADFVFRAESSYSPERFFNVAGGSLGLVQRANWRSAIGVDTFVAGGWFLNLQYLHDVVEVGAERLVRDRRERLATAVLRRSFAYETLDLEIRAFYGLDFDDQLLNASLAYRLNDQISIKLAYDDFAGDSRGPFGQFDQRDQLTLTLSLDI